MAKTGPTSRPQLSAAAAMPADGKPTLKTIAQMSGLAVPTVSRALNDAPDIGSDTKKLVRRIADEIGYVPNRAGVRLRTGRTNVIALVMSTEHDMMNHTARLISSVAGALRDTRYHLNVTPYFPNEDPMKPVRYLVETGSADGIILNQTEPEDARVKYLMQRGFPFATHGRTNWADSHPYFDYDNGAFGELAIDQLHARGRKSVAVVAPPLNQNYAQNMVGGLRRGAARNGQSLLIIPDVTSDSASPEVVAAVGRALATKPVDAIVTASTSSAMATVSAIESAGLQVGREIDVFAKEAIPFLKLFRADILTMAEQVGTAGDFLARAVLQAIQKPDLPAMQYLEVPQGS